MPEENNPFSPKHTARIDSSPEALYCARDGADAGEETRLGRGRKRSEKKEEETKRSRSKSDPNSPNDKNNPPTNTHTTRPVREKPITKERRTPKG